MTDKKIIWTDIDEAPALGGTAFDELKIVRRKHGDAQMTEQIARSPHSRE